MSRETQPITREVARAFGRDEVLPSLASRDRDARWDGALWRRMGSAGLLGAALPKAWGGGGLSAIEACAVMRGFAEGSCDAGLALGWAAHTFGCAIPILHEGSEAQRQRHLPALAHGERIGAWAHEEIHIAGDPIGVVTRAVRGPRGFTLDGVKTRVINGAVADLFLVTAITDPARGKDGVSAFLVERGAHGLRVDERLDTSGMRTAVIAEVVLDRCEVPFENLLGVTGAGLTSTARTVERWLRVGLVAPWAGLTQQLFEETVAVARTRSRHGRTLAHHQLTRIALAEMRIRQELCEGLLERAAAHLDRPGPNADRDIAAARVFLIESFARTVQDAARVQGAEGVTRGSLVERLARDVNLLDVIAGEADVARAQIGSALVAAGKRRARVDANVGREPERNVVVERTNEVDRALDNGRVQEFDGRANGYVAALARTSPPEPGGVARALVSAGWLVQRASALLGARRDR